MCPQRENGVLMKTHHFILALCLAGASAPVHAQIERGDRTLGGNPAIELFTSPDESAPLLGSIGREQNLVPLAETVSAGNIKWYLVKATNGATGWIKSSDAGAPKLMDKFFRPPPAEPSLPLSSDPLPMPATAMSGNAIVVPIYMTGSTVVVPVTLNRAVQTHMILDTGATFSVVSPQVAANLQLRSASRASFVTANGVISSPLARLGSIKVGAAEAINLTVAIQEISPNSQIGGLLGLDFLSRYQTSIDPRRQLLTLGPR